MAAARLIVNDFRRRSCLQDEDFHSADQPACRAATRSEATSPSTKPTRTRRRGTPTRKATFHVRHVQDHPRHRREQRHRRGALQAPRHGARLPRDPRRAVAGEGREGQGRHRGEVPRREDRRRDHRRRVRQLRRRGGGSGEGHGRHVVRVGQQRGPRPRAGGRRRAQHGGGHERQLRGPEARHGRLRPVDPARRRPRRQRLVGSRVRVGQGLCGNQIFKCIDAAAAIEPRNCLGLEHCEHAKPRGPQR